MVSKLEKILFIPDTHRPYHDERAWQLMLKVGKLLKPHHVVVLGDFGDFYAVSSHDKNPNRRHNLEYEINSMLDGLTELESIGGKRYFCAGNHEYRLERYLMQKAPELFNVVKIQDLLQLKQRGWKYTPYRQHLKIGHLHITHECGNAGAQAHMKARDTFQGNVMIGHTHRMAASYQGNARGEAHVGLMCGWLGDATQIEYAHSVNSAQWQRGFGVGYMTPSGIVHVQLVPMITEGKALTCILDGKLYRG